MGSLTRVPRRRLTRTQSRAGRGATRPRPCRTRFLAPRPVADPSLPRRRYTRAMNDSTFDETRDQADEMPTLTLQAALKLAGFVGTGGQAKQLIQGGDVRVNGEVETRRKRKLTEGDEVGVGDEVFVLELEPPEDDDEPVG